MIRTHNEDLRF